MPQPERIAITATGIISALGIGADTHLNALRDGRGGVRLPRHLKTVHAGNYVLGEAPFSNEDLAGHCGISLAEEAATRTTLLAITALQQVVAAAGIELLQQSRLAFLSAGTVGGMCTVEDHYPEYIDAEKKGEATRFIDTLDCAESTEHAAAHFGLKPFMATLSTACSSSANAIMLGARMIRQGLAEKAICGGCDSLSRFTLNGFSSLKNVDKALCRPFDQTRFGLNLGEGAAYLLLEKESDAKRRGATVLAYLSGYANTNDAYHPTAPSPDGAGALRTMQQAIARARLAPEAIDYINAHGTATINNDASEGKAIEALFRNNPPSFSSTKPFTGHTLAAAGAIEAVLSIYAMNAGFAPANLNFSEPMEDISIRPVVHNQEQPIRHLLSNSFGFGGSNVSLVFSHANAPVSG